MTGESKRDRLLVDVDGTVADLIPAFVRWLNDRFHLEVKLTDIVYHNNMGRSPALKDVDEYLRAFHYPDPDGKREDGGFGGAFLEFMRNPRVYSEHVLPTGGAAEALGELGESCQIGFVTALMKRANAHVPDKLDWIGRNFPGIPILTVPSGEKHWVHGTYAVDDRYDTCQKWIGAVRYAFTFGQPWSEFPDQTTGCDWPQVTAAIKMIRGGRLQ